MLPYAKRFDVYSGNAEDDHNTVTRASRQHRLGEGRLELENYVVELQAHLAGYPRILQHGGFDAVAAEAGFVVGVDGAPHALRLSGPKWGGFMR